MPSQSYWFYLESFVYITIKGNDLLLYNTLTGKFLSYINKPRLIEFILELDRKENLYALNVSREFLKENDLEDFVENVKEYFMGDLIDVSLSPKKPFIMPPHFDKQEVDINNIAKPRVLKNVSGDSIFSLNELTFFVNNRCDNNCTACKTACKQFLWCTAGKERTELTLTLEEIEEVLAQVKACPIKNIDIIGGDLTQYPHLDPLVDLLSRGSFNVNYYFHLSHLDLKKGVPPAIQVIQASRPRARINVLVESSSLTAPVDLSCLKELEPDRLVFVIQKEEEIPIIEQAVEDLKIGNISISVQPYFNGHNLDFFKANVFIDQESLTENIPDIGAIKARKSYNTLNYGKLFIKSDKNIYSGLNGVPLGRIGEITMEKAVISELTEHGNWLRTRRNETPCCDCLLNAICPPLSNFEIATGIYNSCNIREDQRTLK
jgi:pseudo-rSAM protein